MPMSSSSVPAPTDILGLRRLGHLAPSTEGSSALDLKAWPPPTESQSTVLTLVPSDLVPSEPVPSVRDIAAPAQAWSPRPSAGADPVLYDQAVGLVQALVEILAGDRTLTQLVRWTSAEVYELLHHRVNTLASCPRAEKPTSRPAAGRRRRPRLASLHVSNPDDDIAEITARIDHGVRSTAVALRMERRAAARRVIGAGVTHRVADHRWMCTAISWA